MRTHRGVSSLAVSERAARPLAAAVRSPADTGQSKLSYHAGLDGIRALAIIAVLLFHGGTSWAGGGFLGVGAFFVLSCFLIPSLLLLGCPLSATMPPGLFWRR